MTVNITITLTIIIVFLLIGGWWLKGKDTLEVTEPNETKSFNLSDDEHVKVTTECDNETPSSPMMLVVVANYSVKRYFSNKQVCADDWVLFANKISYLRLLANLTEIDAVLVDSHSFKYEQLNELSTICEFCKVEGINVIQLVDSSLCISTEIDLSNNMSALRSAYSKTLTRKYLERKLFLPELGYQLSDREQLFIHKLFMLLNAKYGDTHFNSEAAASQLALSSRQLNRLVNRVFGTSFSKYLQRYRLARAKHLLEQGLSVTSVAMEVGFSNSSTFSRAYKTNFGYSPSKENEQVKT